MLMIFAVVLFVCLALNCSNQFCFVFVSVFLCFMKSNWCGKFTLKKKIGNVSDNVYKQMH